MKMEFEKEDKMLQFKIKNAATNYPNGGLLPSFKINNRRNIEPGLDKRQERLDARISDFDRMKSENPREFHKPGSLKK
jgi:hypothetical protein